MANIFQLRVSEFDNNLNGHSLIINMAALRDRYEYVGLWYVKDGNQKTSITTEIYTGSGAAPERLLDFTDELKENAFKQVNRHELSRTDAWVAIATRIDNNRYCKLKTGKVQSGRLLVNYKILHNKSFGFDILGKGIFRGGKADFFMIGSEDGVSREDYRDAIIYIVCMKGLPPADWNIHDTYIGIENLPIFAPTFKFSDDRDYSTWEEQHPLEKIQ
jgi:hypothetical protein